MTIDTIFMVVFFGVFFVLPALGSLLREILGFSISFGAADDEDEYVAHGNGGWIFDFFLLDVLPFAFSSDDDHDFV